jgi:hypothetical protein
MPARLFLTAILLLCPLYVLAEEAAVEKTEDRSPEKIELSVKMQALLESLDTPEKALQESQKYQQNGQFGLAKIVLLRGIELAEAKGS